MFSNPSVRKRAQMPLLVGLTLLAACVRLPGLSASFYGDEGFSLLRDSSELLTPTEDRFRPLFFSLLYLWKQLGFHGEAGLRALPMLFGVLQIPVGLRLGALLGGMEAGVVFSLLLALNPMLIEFSQELRMYSLAPLIALLQAWAFAAAAERSSAGRSTVGAWAAFVLAGVAGVYTHFHYWFVMAGFGVAALVRWRSLPLRQSIAAMAAVVLLYLPDVPNLLRFQREAASAPHLVAADLPSALPKLVAAVCVGFNYFNLPHLGIDRAIRASALRSNLALALLAALPAVILASRLVSVHRRADLRPLANMSHELFAVPALVSFLAVIVLGRDFIHPKYMSSTAPFLLLLVTAAYLAISRPVNRLIVALAGAAVCGIAIVHFNQPEKYGRREDWRGAAGMLRSVLDDDSTLLWLGNANSPSRLSLREPPQSLWEYYAPDLFPRIRVVPIPGPAATVHDVEPILAPLVSGKRGVYYLWSEIGANVTDPHDVLVKAARETLGRENVTQLNPRLVLYRWEAK
jgi:mannosyltransferase